MSGFDLPPITGFDTRFRQNPLTQLLPQELLQGPEGLAGPQDPLKIPTPGERAIRPGEVGQAKPFSGVLADSLDQVAALRADARDKVRGMVLGEDVELHDVMIAGSKSEVAFNLLLEVRNKMVDAWEKLSRSSG
ncbi:MAG: flagellar hook-basal body complex protein FliE [Planctomycetes bacterium]|nr:flagellar hook-basal body complex protein FliE [Planctomycetota bacterium]